MNNYKQKHFANVKLWGVSIRDWTIEQALNLEPKDLSSSPQSPYKLVQVI